MSSSHGLIYAALFFGMFFEANVTILTGMFLITQGRVNPALAVILIAGGGYGEQFLHYLLGLYLSKHDRVTRWAAKITGRYDSRLQHNPFRYLVISKFVYGFHRAVLIRLGMLKVSVREFVKASVPATAIWLTAISTLGLVFSYSYNILKNYIKYAELVLLGLVIAFFIAEYFVSKRFENDLDS